jgi:recombinational DNA repair ATPase RecF
VYDGERADLRALDQLEAVLRELGEEMATWRARALKAEPSRGGGGGGGARSSELESENRQLRGRLEAARVRVQELVTRLAFLEEQSREAGTTGGSTAR